MNGINWGDVPTWLAVVAAAAAGWAALRQLRIQREDMARQLTQLERQQANQVGVSWQEAAPAFDADGEKVLMVVVENGSSRPIRAVSTQVVMPIGKPPEFPVAVGEMITTAMPPGSQWFAEPRAGTTVGVIRSGKTFGFKFALPWQGNENPPVMAGFTDDAGLDWLIDADLHLYRVRQFLAGKKQLGRKSIHVLKR